MVPFYLDAYFSPVELNRSGGVEKISGQTAPMLKVCSTKTWKEWEIKEDLGDKLFVLWH